VAPPTDGPGRPTLLVAGTAAAIAAAPASVLAALAAADLVPQGAAGLLALGFAAAGLLAGLVWYRELVRLSRALHRAEAGLPPDDLPRLPPLRRVAEAADRLATSIRARGQEVDRLSRAAVRIVEGLPDPLIVLDGDARPVTLNAAARDAFTPPGSRTPDLGALLRHPALRAAVDRVAGGGQPESISITLPVPVERELVAQVTALDPPLPDGGRIMLVLSDRTRERRIEQMRADFIANANHELRTPLASLIGFIETLRGPAADDREAQARFLPIMAEQAQRMSRLIDDMLSLSRIEMTEHTPPRGSADLAVLARRSAEALEPRLAARRMRIELQVADGVRPIVADQDQIAQVMANLLDNAVKYGREGGRIVIRVAPAPPRGGRPPGVTVAVSDDGQGIPRRHIPRLTERFYRVDAARSRAVGGTGLGLAIVKHILNRHRGSLEIESEEGKGSTFTVWLPAAEPEAGSARG
jgi:two-component system phosphate regulon sensor histidine kinase PhoR